MEFDNVKEALEDLFGVIGSAREGKFRVKASTETEWRKGDMDDLLDFVLEPLVNVADHLGLSETYMGKL